MRRLRLFSIGGDLLDLRGVARYSEIDGIHVDADGHAAVADAVQADPRPVTGPRETEQSVAATSSLTEGWSTSAPTHGSDSRTSSFDPGGAGHDSAGSGVQVEGA